MSHRLIPTRVSEPEPPGFDVWGGGRAEAGYLADALAGESEAEVVMKACRYWATGRTSSIPMVLAEDTPTIMPRRIRDMMEKVRKANGD